MGYPIESVSQVMENEAFYRDGLHYGLPTPGSATGNFNSQGNGVPIAKTETELEFPGDSTKK